MKSKLYVLWIVFCSLFIRTNCIDKNINQSVVTSGSPEASQAGIDILNKGGNAIDAAIAVSFALGVTEPMMSGLGGGTQVLLHLPGHTPIMINGTTFSPKGTPTYLDSNNLIYHQRSTIPSTVKILYYIWNKYGSGKMDWDELVSPAIELGENGFQIGRFRGVVYQKNKSLLLESPHHVEPWLLNGKIPLEGDWLKQPLLAATLKRIAHGGESEFYRGEIAREIARDMSENNGWITLEDLNNFPDPVELPALMTQYRGYDIYTSTPPCGGWVMLRVLNELSNTTIESMSIDSLRLFHMVSALKNAHNERIISPIKNLRNFEKEINLKFDDNNKLNSNNGETTHFSIVDRNGIAVAVTSSINAYFGAKAASNKLGFLYNTYMDDFIFGDSSHPYAIGPGKMAFSSMTPTIVLKDGKPVLLLGSPGSARIISSVAQIVSAWIDEKLSIKEAVSRPRVHVSQGNAYFEDDQDFHLVSSQLDLLGLKRKMVNPFLLYGGLNAYYGGVHAIALENGKWVGAADPRRDGQVYYSN